MNCKLSSNFMMSFKENVNESTKSCGYCLSRYPSYQNLNIARKLSALLFTNLWRCQLIGIGILLHMYKNSDLDDNSSLTSNNTLTIMRRPKLNV